MSTLRPRPIQSPPIPQSLELDAHTQTLFATDEQCGAVDTRFKLSVPELAGAVFIGRVAKNPIGALHMVAQVVKDDSNDGKGGCLISVLPLNFGAADARERIQLTRQYLSTHLSYPDITDAKVWQDRVPTLEDDSFEDGWRRVHFDAASGFCLLFDAHGCSLMDLRDEKVTQRRVESLPYVELGDALFGWDAPQNSDLAFVLMEEAAFHHRVEELLNDSDCVLHHSVCFLAMDETERRRHVFGCKSGI